MVGGFYVPLQTRSPDGIFVHLMFLPKFPKGGREDPGGNQGDSEGLCAIWGGSGGCGAVQGGSGEFSKGVLGRALGYPDDPKGGQKRKV